MDNLKRLVHLLILIPLFLSRPSWSLTHSDHDHKDYTDCLYETGTGNLNVDQVLCLEKGCECYTKVFKNQIDGLKEDRIEMIQEKMVDVHSQIVSKVVSELTDINTIYEQSDRSLLVAGSNIQTACSFDSLKQNLSCRSSLAKEIAKNIKEIFLKKSDYNYGEKNKGQVETPYQCLSKGEVRGVTLHKERSKHLETIYDRLSGMTEELKIKIEKSENPLKLFEEIATRKERRLLLSIRSLPILRNLFQSQAGLKAIFKEIDNKSLTKENFSNRLTSSETIQVALNQSITKKCHQIFKSIDSLACQKIAHPYISNEDFNFNVFGYNETEPETDLETHLFACKGKVCLKDNTCSSKESNLLDSNQLLSSILGKERISDLMSKETESDTSKQVNRRICALLVCGDKSHGKDLFNKQVNSMKESCDPKLNPKRTPMEAYTLLKCPDSDVCQMPEMEDFKAYLKYFKSNMLVETQTMMVQVDGTKYGLEGGEAKKAIISVSKKKSPFLKNFMGEVGEDLDGFFATSVEKVQLAKKEIIHKKIETDTVVAKMKVQSRGKIFETPKASQGWNQYGNQKDIINNGSAFTATQIGAVSVGSSSSLNKRENEYRITTVDAIKTATDSLNQVSELKKELQNAKDANKGFDGTKQNSFGNQQREIVPVSVVSRVNDSDHFDDISTNAKINNSDSNQNSDGEMYTAAPYAQVEIPTEEALVSEFGLPKIKSKESGASSNASVKEEFHIPTFEITLKNLTKLNVELVEEFEIVPEDSFIIKVSIRKGKKKKIIPVMVENVPYKGKLILRPIKEVGNREIFAEVLASPLFENYRMILAIREERKKFFNEILPRIKRI